MHEVFYSSLSQEHLYIQLLHRVYLQLSTLHLIILYFNLNVMQKISWITISKLLHFYNRLFISIVVGITSLLFMHRYSSYFTLYTHQLYKMSDEIDCGWETYCMDQLHWGLADLGVMVGGYFQLLFHNLKIAKLILLSTNLYITDIHQLKLIVSIISLVI